MAKVVVVTGAGAGVGRATAEEFARKGYNIALLAREPERLGCAADELNARYGVRTMPIPTDVADAAAVDRAASDVERELGPIDVWVNVAMSTVFASDTAGNRAGGPRSPISGRRMARLSFGAASEHFRL